jgi:hypothetical protein
MRSFHPTLVVTVALAVAGCHKTEDPTGKKENSTDTVHGWELMPPAPDATLLPPRRRCPASARPGVELRIGTHLVDSAPVTTTRRTSVGRTGEQDRLSRLSPSRTNPLPISNIVVSRFEWSTEPARPSHWRPATRPCSSFAKPWIRMVRGGKSIRPQIRDAVIAFIGSSLDRISIGSFRPDFIADRQKPS